MKQVQYFYCFDLIAYYWNLSIFTVLKSCHLFDWEFWILLSDYFPNFPYQFYFYCYYCSYHFNWLYLCWNRIFYFWVWEFITIVEVFLRNFKWCTRHLLGFNRDWWWFFLIILNWWKFRFCQLFYFFQSIRQIIEEILGNWVNRQHNMW